jgi:hypothetical protein
MKVCVLVTLSYNQTIYRDHQRVWREFAHSHPDVTTYFVVSSPNCISTTQIDDILLTPGEEGYPNGKPSGARLEKTIDALEWISSQNYDFVVRTGLSSLWIYPNLIQFLNSLPKQKVYCGINGGGFVSGAGIIMSKDVCDVLCNHKAEVCAFPDEEDVKIGYFMQKYGISQSPASRTDIMSYDHYPNVLIPSNAYHFRIKLHISDPNVRKNEVIIMRDILRRFSKVLNF